MTIDINSLSPAALSALSGLGGAVIGGLAAIGAGWFERRQEWRYAKKGLASAVAAEIGAVLDTIERRDFVNYFSEILSAWKRGERLEETPGFVDNTPNDLSRVFSHNMDKIGMLGPAIAADTVRFYTFLEAIQTDLLALSAGNVEDLDGRITLLEEDLDLWRETEAIGKRLITELPRISS